MRLDLEEIEQLRVALPLGVSTTLAGWLFSYDKVAVSRDFAPDQFAVYRNGAWELPPPPPPEPPP